jgi:hypothetical protein
MPRVSQGFLSFSLVCVFAVGTDCEGGHPGWQFAPSVRRASPSTSDYNGGVLSATVECNSPSVPSNGFLQVRLRLHWNGFGFKAFNPFMDPTLEPVTQLAVFKGNEYIGNLTGWRPAAPIDGLETPRSVAVAVRWDRGNGVTGRTVLAAPVVQPEKGDRMVLAPGRYRMQLVVYDWLLRGGPLDGPPKECCRSESVEFEIVPPAPEVDGVRPRLPECRHGIDFRFVGEPARFEIENTSEAAREIYDPWLAHYPQHGNLGSYRFEWQTGGGKAVVDAFVPEALPRRDHWVRVPAGGFAGRDLFLQPTIAVMSNGRASIIAIVGKGVFADEAFPDREAPFEFHHRDAEIFRSRQISYVPPNWLADAPHANREGK